MSTTRLPAKEFLSLSTGHLVIDVRSPAEWKHAHIPGAINIPLFDDEERRVVGTAYKQESREKAIKIGLDFFGPKMRKIVEQVEEQISTSHKLNSIDSADSSSLSTGKGGGMGPETRNKKPETVLIYCWRGGMRSGAIAWLLDLYGFKVNLLSGGYKAYRNIVLKTFEFPFSFKVLGGFTGSGKTELLHELKRAGETIIDLEGIANHKGSAFGNIDMPEQPGQEMFENLLAMELLTLSTDAFIEREASTVNREDSSGASLMPHASRLTNGIHQTRSAANGDTSEHISLTPHASRITNESQGIQIWIEDESQRIGLLNLPGALWKTIRQSPVCFLEIPFESRLDHIVQEYGRLNHDRLGDAITRISKRLGPQDTKASLTFLAEGDIKECFRILLKYYDKHYLKALYNREAVNGLLTKIACETVTVHNANLLTPVLHE